MVYNNILPKSEVAFVRPLVYFCACEVIMYGIKANRIVISSDQLLRLHVISPDQL